MYRRVKGLGLCLPVTKISFQWPLVTLLHCSRSQVSCVHLSLGVHGITNAAPLPQPSPCSPAGIPLPPIHKSLFSVPPNHTPRIVLSTGKLRQGDTAMSEGLAAAPSYGDHVPECFGSSMTTESRQMAGTAQRPKLCRPDHWLPGRLYPSTEERVAASPFNSIKNERYRSTRTCSPGLPVYCRAPWPFGLEPIRS